MSQLTEIQLNIKFPVTAYKWFYKHVFTWVIHVLGRQSWSWAMKKWMPLITRFMGDSSFIILTIIIIYLTANELSPVGSGYNACTKIRNKDLRNLSREGYMKSMKKQPGVLGTISASVFRHRETKKTRAEVAGRRTFRILTSSQQSGN